MIFIIKSCQTNIEHIQQEYEITKLIEAGCRFAEQVLERLLSPSTQQILRKGYEDAVNDNINTDFDLRISAKQKEVIKITIQDFLALIHSGLNKRFGQNFKKFKHFFSEMEILRPLAVLRINEHSCIRFRYLAGYNNLDHTELVTEFKSFVREFKMVLQESK